jgi:hypothetical protein
MDPEVAPNENRIFPSFTQAGNRAYTLRNGLKRPDLPPISEANLAKGMRQVNGVYTQIYNRRYRTVGHLLKGRYKAILI